MWKVTGNVSMVDVDTGHRSFICAVGCRPTEDAGVATNVGSHPVSGDVVGIRVYGVLPSLQCDVSILQSRVSGFYPWLDCERISIVGQEASVVVMRIGGIVERGRSLMGGVDVEEEDGA